MMVPLESWRFIVSLCCNRNRDLQAELHGPQCTSTSCWAHSPWSIIVNSYWQMLSLTDCWLPLTIGDALDHSWLAIAIVVINHHLATNWWLIMIVVVWWFVNWWLSSTIVIICHELTTIKHYSLIITSWPFLTIGSSVLFCGVLAHHKSYSTYWLSPVKPVTSSQLATGSECSRPCFTCTN